MAVADDFRRRNYVVWETIAETWASRAGYVEQTARPVSDWMLRELRLEPDQTLLELAAGTGELGFAALTGLDGEARLICTDFSPALVEAARRRAESLGIAGVDFRVADIERLELEDDSVDRVLCRIGYMFATDPVATFADTRRVLRPGGRVTLSVWGPPDRNPFFSVIGRVLVTRGHTQPPPQGGPGLFAMADSRRLRGQLTDAGFADVRVEEVAVHFDLADVDDYLAIATDTGGPMALVLRGLSAEDRAAVADDVRKAFAPFARDSGGFELPGVANCAVAA